LFHQNNEKEKEKKQKKQKKQRNNKLNNLTINMNSQRVQHDEVGSTWYSTEQNNLGSGNGMQPGDPALCQL